jgi:hypothetical protein
VLICPHCGAENPDYSSFCSLCLARFSRGGEAHNPSPPPAADPVQQQAPPAQRPSPEAGNQYVSPGDYRALVQEQRQAPVPNNPPQGDYGPYAGGQSQVPGQQNTPPENQQPAPAAYVSPGDYHALQSEMRQPQNPGLNRDSAYYQAAMQNPGSVHAAQVPIWLQKRSTSDRVLIVAKYSFLIALMLFGITILLSFILVGAALSGSLTSWNLANFLVIGVQLFILIWAGYITSYNAMERGRGWMYGAACVAAIELLWLPLLFFMFIFILSGEPVLPMIDIVSLFLVIFLYIPLGALGGWLAERRYMG